MFVIIGILVVFGAVAGGYLMEHGNLRVLMQPAELIIIGGAAVGTVLVANPLHILKKIAGGLVSVFGGSKCTRKFYLEALKTMYDLFNKARREGLIALESDVEEPEKSPIFTKNPVFLKDHHVRDFVCDTMRMAVTGGIEPLDVDQMMELDMEVHHHGATQPVAALSTMADSLPGLGIVAAVLGVVITVGALGGPLEQIGEKVAAVLVGTFLGILLCYGLSGHHHQETGRSRRDPMGRMERRLCRLLHRRDGVVYRPVADEQQQASPGSGGRLLQESHRLLKESRHQHAGRR